MFILTPLKVHFSQKLCCYEDFTPSGLSRQTIAPVRNYTRVVSDLGKVARPRNGEFGGHRAGHYRYRRQHSRIFVVCEEIIGLRIDRRRRRSYWLARIRPSMRGNLIRTELADEIFTRNIACREEDLTRDQSSSRFKRRDDASRSTISDGAKAAEAEGVQRARAIVAKLKRLSTELCGHLCRCEPPDRQLSAGRSERI